MKFLLIAVLLAAGLWFGSGAVADKLPAEVASVLGVQEAEAWCWYGDLNCGGIYADAHGWTFCNDVSCHPDWVCFQGWYAWANHFWQSWLYNYGYVPATFWSTFWIWWNPCGMWGY